MKFIFKKAYKKSNNKYLLKIQLTDKEEDYTWMGTTKEVYVYADKNFEDGEVIGLEYSEKNGQFFVYRINKDGNNVKKESEETEEETTETKSKVSGPVCEDCGAKLKSDKYKKCYTCNQKSGGSKKSPETQESIKTQSAYKIAAMALSVFTGQIADIGTLKEHLDDLAGHLKSKF